MPVRTNPPRGRSRLFRRPSNYVLVQGANILRITALYKPLEVFFGAAALLLLLGAALVPAVAPSSSPRRTHRDHLQSLLLAAVLLLAGVLSFLTGLLADLISINRQLLEELKLRESRNRAAEARLRKVEFRRNTDQVETQEEPRARCPGFRF